MSKEIRITEEEGEEYYTDWVKITTGKYPAEYDMILVQLNQDAPERARAIAQMIAEGLKKMDEA